MSIMLFIMHKKSKGVTNIISHFGVIRELKFRNSNFDWLLGCSIGQM